MSKKELENRRDVILNSEDMSSQRVKILKEKCTYLHKSGQPFTLVKSGSTYELISRLWNEKAFRGGFSVEELRFIKSVKQHVLDKDILINFIDKDYKGEEIDYIRVNKHKSGEVVENLIYIDINNAYWETARILGVIDDKIYSKGTDVKKTVRLAALGSLAKQKSVWSYDGNKFSKEEPEANITENIWFAICKRVSDVMVRISKKLGDKFVFYWVDGIYVKDTPSTLSYVIEEFIKAGYTSKFAKIPYVKFEDNGFTVQGMLKNDIKEFNWDINGSKKQNKPITDYIENKRLLALANEIMYRKSPKKRKSKR